MEQSSLYYRVAQFDTHQPKPAPTIIFLHGRGSDENDLLDLASNLDSRFLTISVRAPFQFPYGGFTWFSMDEMGNPDIEQMIESRRLLVKFLEEIQTAQPVDPHNIFLFGFSMGAMIALDLALQSLYQFKGVVAHSGLVLQNEQLSYSFNQLHTTSFFIAHGTYDQIVPIELARNSYELLRANARVQFHEYPIQHTISDESLHDISLWLREHIGKNPE